MAHKIFVWTLAWCLVATVALAQEKEKEKPDQPDAALSRTGYLSLGLAGGYVFDPEMGAGMISLDYYITDEISVGPAFQFGAGQNDNYWGISGQFKYAPPLANNDAIRPYGTLGIGYADLDFDDGDNGGAYLFPIGGGIEFELMDILSLDVGAVFNITEDSFAGLLVGCRVLL